MAVFSNMKIWDKKSDSSKKIYSEKVIRDVGNGVD